MKPETPRCASPLSPQLWKPKRRKNYPHFDGHLSDRAINTLVTDQACVARNPFFPFIVFEKKFNRFGTTLPRKDREKLRKLRYAARKDAYIYEYYRGILSQLYEKELVNRNLSNVVIAYRKLKTADGRGMCSVDFAQQAFTEIFSRDHCVAMALDISGYFESLDHLEIKRLWCGLLGRAQLPPDHYAVFRSITRYSQIERDEVYRRLGILKWDSELNRWKHTRKRAEIPVHLCSAAEFRSKIVKPPGAIWTNVDSFGIPQGAPISDLIANFYLLDFDQRVQAFAQKIGGYYRRYCDDILIVYSDPTVKWETVESYMQAQITKCGAQLKIKPSKTCVHSFDKSAPQKCVSLKGDEKHFEYLGFQFDGIEARFRDKTVSAFYRKLKWSIFSEARALVRKFPGKPLPFIQKKFDTSALMEKFGRRKGFATCDDVHQWTFWTYVTKSVKIMGPLGPRLYRQVSNYKKFVRHHVPAAIAAAHAKRPIVL